MHVREKKTRRTGKKRRPKRDSGSVRVLGYISGGLSSFFLFSSYCSLVCLFLPFLPAKMKNVTRGQIKSEFKETKERTVAKEKIVVFYFIVGGRVSFFSQPWKSHPHCTLFTQQNFFE